MTSLAFLCRHMHPSESASLTEMVKALEPLDINKNQDQVIVVDSDDEAEQPAAAARDQVLIVGDVEAEDNCDQSVNRYSQQVSSNSSDSLSFFARVLKREDGCGANSLTFMVNAIVGNGSTASQSIVNSSYRDAGSKSTIATATAAPRRETIPATAAVVTRPPVPIALPPPGGPPVDLSPRPQHSALVSTAMNNSSNALPTARELIPVSTAPIVVPPISPLLEQQQQQQSRPTAAGSSGVSRRAQHLAAAKAKASSFESLGDEDDFVARKSSKADSANASAAASTAQRTGGAGAARPNGYVVSSPVQQQQRRVRSASPSSYVLSGGQQRRSASAVGNAAPGVSVGTSSSIYGAGCSRPSSATSTYSAGPAPSKPFSGNNSHIVAAAAARSSGVASANTSAVTSSSVSAASAIYGSRTAYSSTGSRPSSAAMQRPGSATAVRSGLPPRGPAPPPSAAAVFQRGSSMASQCSASNDGRDDDEDCENINRCHPHLSGRTPRGVPLSQPASGLPSPISATAAAAQQQQHASKQQSNIPSMAASADGDQHLHGDVGCESNDDEVDEFDRLAHAAPSVNNSHHSVYGGGLSGRSTSTATNVASHHHHHHHHHHNAANNTTMINSSQLLSLAEDATCYVQRVPSATSASASAYGSAALSSRPFSGSASWWMRAQQRTAATPMINDASTLSKAYCGGPRSRPASATSTIVRPPRPASATSRR